MKVKITGYRSGVFSKDDKTISYHHMYIENPLKAYKDADVVAGYETIQLKVADAPAGYIEEFINSHGCLPAEPIEVLFDMYGRVEDVDFYV